MANLHQQLQEGSVSSGSFGQSFRTRKLTSQVMDAFDAFGEDEEEDSKVCRDPSDGILAFHKGTESSLLQFVESRLSSEELGADSSLKVLELVDQFCYERHWMMHVGPEKGRVLESHLDECLESFKKDSERSGRPFFLLEVGTYCGYSLIRMVRRILKLLGEKASFQVITVDISSENQSFACRLVRLAGFEAYVNFVQMGDPDADDGKHCQLVDLVRQAIPERLSKESMVDFVFLDHAKELYLSDLIQLEQNKIICRGTYVAADNVLFFHLDSYREHMRALSESGIVATRLEEGLLEYVVEQEGDRDGTKVRDGIELSYYLEDPPIQLKNSK